jgi:hypothetical protein
MAQSPRCANHPRSPSNSRIHPRVTRITRMNARPLAREARRSSAATAAAGTRRAPEMSRVSVGSDLFLTLLAFLQTPGEAGR